MKSYHRGWRRHHRHRLVLKTLRIHSSRELAVRAVDNLAKCSCWMCGNPRRKLFGKEKLSLKERRLEKEE